jgi:hemerythrin-like domain-containing protein
MTDEPMADARDMFAVHTMFRREFGAIPRLVRAVAAGDEQRAAVVADHITLMNEVLAIHHSGEDKHIWSRLHERAATETTPMIGLMEEQHEGIYKGYLRLNQAVEAWRETASAETRDMVAELIEELLPLLTHHLALEEEHVVPLIETHLTKAEYAGIPEDAATETPPGMLPVIFGMIMYEGNPEVIDSIVAGMSAEVQPVIKDVATAAYAAYAEKVYGTATPPRSAA